MSNFLEPYVAARARLIQSQIEVAKLPDGNVRDQLEYVLDVELDRLNSTMTAACRGANTIANRVERVAATLRAQQKGEQT